MQNQLSWVQKHVSTILSQTDSVIVSVGSKLHNHGSDSKRYIRRRKREAYDQDNILSSVEFPRELNGLEKHIQQRDWATEIIIEHKFVPTSWWSIYRLLF